MTAEERAKRIFETVLQNASFDTVHIELADTVVEAIRKAESAAMERVARRVVGSFIVFDRGHTVVSIECDEGYFTLERAANLDRPSIAETTEERHPTFAACLAALTDEERAAWERDDA